MESEHRVRYNFGLHKQTTDDSETFTKKKQYNKFDWNFWKMPC